VHKAELKRTSKTVVAVAVAALMAVGFAAGWLVAQIQSASKQSQVDVLANGWISSIELLVRNGSDLEPVDPKTTQLLIGFGLNIDSAELAHFYDGMTPALKKRLAFHVPAARAIANVQNGAGSMQDRGDLLAFVDCVQKVQSQGGSVRECFERRKNKE